MSAAATATRGRLARPRPELAAIALIVALAAAVRLWSLAKVPGDPFYDAAVRSMPLSLHNFLLGAYEPGGSLAVDKPPLDLWLQVLSTQLFGFGSVTLKLPAALAGTAAVAVLYDAVRRAFGTAEGLAAALALALLPIAVLTARSDTMDAVAMLLDVAALWLLVRGTQTGRIRWSLGAAAALGLAFNVKLFQGLVPLPALLALAVLARRERRLLALGGSAAVFVAVALSWLVLTLAVPSSQRPYPIGSTNGSAWNATFVYNGWDRITGTATQATLSAQLSPAQLRPANNSEAARSAVPIGAPSLLRLFAHDGPLSGLRLGFVLLAALLLGVPALAWAAFAPRGPDPGLQRATGISLALWLLIGVVLYTAMARLHPRYTEGFTPAVAAAVGIGAGWALRDGIWQRLATAVAAVALALYGRFLLGGSDGTWRVLAIGAVVAAGASVIARARIRIPLAASGLAVAVLALPVAVDRSLIANHELDSGRTGAMGSADVMAITAYIRAHRRGAHYEFVAADPSEVGALIVAARQPILSLTSYDAHELLPLSRLARLVRSGALRFALINGACGRTTSRRSALCSPGAAWVRAHGTDVSRRAGVGHSHVLYQLAVR